MIAVIIILIMAALMFVLSAFFFKGRGAMLVAGYNTASEEEKRKYDEKKLLKAMGTAVFAIGVMLIAMSVYMYMLEYGFADENTALAFAAVFGVLILADIVLLNIYVSKKCRKEYE